MTKKASSQPKKNQPPVSQRSWGVWAAVAVAILLIIGGAVMLWPQPGPAAPPIVAPQTSAAPQPAPGSEAPTTKATPKVVVAQTEIDAGYQTFGTLIETTFTIRNEGGGTLQLSENPKVKLVEGC